MEEEVESVRRQAREDVARAKEEADMSVEEERCRALKELERVRGHSASLLETLRGTQTNLAAEADRARAAADEAEDLRRRSSLLSDENAALRSNSAKGEERHREELAQWERAARAAQLVEVAVREEAADKVRKLEASDRQRRKQAESENAGSLVKALEEMERQQSGVLSAALQRSDAALGEVARVKEAMWNKAEENADALREAFEAAAERAAEEAEQATNEALARAERAYQGKLALALVARDAAAAGRARCESRSIERSPDRPQGRSPHERRGADEVASTGLRRSDEEKLSQAQHEEALRAALDSQRAQHERQLEAELAARDAEALEALRLLDAQHRRGDFGRHTAVDAVNGGGGGGHGDSGSAPPPSRAPSASVPARSRQREALTKPPPPAAAMVAAIRSAAAARAEALREATEESHRLEEAMSSSPSPSPSSVRGDPGRWYVAAPPRPVRKKTEVPVTGDGNGDGSNSSGLSYDDGGGSRYLPQQHGGEDAGAPGGSGTPRSGRRLRRRREASADGRGGDDDVAAVLRVSADAGGGGGGEIGDREPETGGADDADPGLTDTEKRYKRELEALRGRVWELEGMVGGRLEERERAYRRKLRAAVAECRSSRVRNHGPPSNNGAPFNTRAPSNNGAPFNSGPPFKHGPPVSETASEIGARRGEDTGDLGPRGGGLRDGPRGTGGDSSRHGSPSREGQRTLSVTISSRHGSRGDGGRVRSNSQA
ncbi:unnamed protein product [Ectocarpus fasciculatus]